MRPPTTGVVRSGENFLYLLQGRAERAVRLAARVARGAAANRNRVWTERHGLAGGRDAPAGNSPLPVRPLRLSPMTATAGGRATATPGTGPHQLATITPTGQGPRAKPRASARRSRHEAAKAHSDVSASIHPRR